MLLRTYKRSGKKITLFRVTLLDADSSSSSIVHQPIKDRTDHKYMIEIKQSLLLTAGKTAHFRVVQGSPHFSRPISSGHCD